MARDLTQMLDTALSNGEALTRRLMDATDRASAVVHSGYRAALRGADMIDGLAAARGSDLIARLVPEMWASAKLTGLFASLPWLYPLTGLVIGLNTQQAKQTTTAYPDIIDDIVRGRPTRFPTARTTRLPAAGRYVISSDLHHYTPGYLDWPEIQRTKPIYEAMLHHYADNGYHLIENGDIEDFWLAGGSAYGVVYDIARACTVMLPEPLARYARPVTYGEHLERIIANNAGIYRTVNERFHLEGRYTRLVGNHDDPYQHAEVAELLSEYLPGLHVYDFAILDAPDRVAGVVAHGHHTDAWNGPDGAIVGMLFTALMSAVHDARFLGSTPGLPEPEMSDELLEGEVHDDVRSVSPVLGANAALDTLDEVALFDALRMRWGAEYGSLENAPVFVLGHTHRPLTRPRVPSEGTDWVNYFNSGSGVTYDLVTCLEWDGTDDPAHPVVKLVAWHGTDDGPAGDVEIQTSDGRRIVREEMIGKARLERAPAE